MKRNILAIETATNVCSVSLFLRGEFIEELSSDEIRSHAKKLPVFVDEILENNKLQAIDLHGVAVSSGPGSYTGLRIGMSLAKGIALSLSLPIIPINTLDALCVNQSIEGEFWMCIFSHRDYVFAQKYSSKSSIGEPRCVPISKLDDAPKFGVDLQKIDNQLQFHSVKPTANNIGIIALEKFEELAKHDLAKVSPFYLTEFNVSR